MNTASIPESAKQRIEDVQKLHTRILERIGSCPAIVAAKLLIELEEGFMRLERVAGPILSADSGHQETSRAKRA